MSDYNDCTFEGCTKHKVRNGLCEGHAGQARRGQELKPLRDKRSKGKTYCAFDECERAVHGTGLCITHYYQIRNGTELRPIRKYTRKNEEKGVTDAD